MEKMDTTKEVPSETFDVQSGEVVDTLNTQSTTLSNSHGEYKRVISARQVHVRCDPQDH